VISSIITFKTFFACLAYSIIIGDSFSSILKAFHLPSSLTSRSNVILGLSSCVIFPLCMLKNMDALKYTSILGLSGIAYCAVFMLLRYFDGSYRAGGKFIKDISSTFMPSFGVRKADSTPVHVVFVLISMMATAYVAHYNAPKFWAELKQPTLKRYNTVVASAFGLAAAIYMSVMWAGFLTFGGHSTGFILNNYSAKDQLATFARLAIGFGILCGYPLTFSALRDGTFDLLKIKDAATRDKAVLPTTVAMMGVITSFALVLKNVGVVVSFSGALIGAMLIYFVPAVMNICNIRAEARGATNTAYKKAHRNTTPPASLALQLTSSQQLELAGNYGMAAMGIVIAVIGVTVTLMGSSSH